MKDVKSSIPSTGALLAFEATARLGSVARAAEELEISSPAISRHIGRLEDALNVLLFERKGRGLVLTKGGEEYFVSVQSSIQSLRAAGNRLHARNTILTVGCTQAVSVMILLPLYPRLKLLLDNDIDLRVLNCEYDMLPALLPVGVDVFFEYSTVCSDQHSEKLFVEEVVPVASPPLRNASGGRSPNIPLNGSACPVWPRPRRERLGQRGRHGSSHKTANPRRPGSKNTRTTCTWRTLRRGGRELPWVGMAS